MNHRKTGRIFTLALRVADAQRIDEPLGTVKVVWDIRWQDIFPPDIAPSSTFMVRHSFSEEGIWTYPMDYLGSNRRNHTLTCNIVDYSHVSDQVNTYQGGVNAVYPVAMTLYTRANATALKHGFLNNMENTMGAFNAISPDTNSRIGYLQGTCHYRAAPREFECYSPESRKVIEITYWDQSPPPTLAQLNSTTNYYFYKFTSPDQIPSPGNAIPMFYRVNNNQSAPQIIDTGPPQGLHVFEFELLDKTPFHDNQFH